MAAASHPRSLAALLVERLRARQPEIERTIFTRIEAVSDVRVGDPEYLLGLRNSVGAALGYALSALEHGERRAGPVPTELLNQARKAARNGISLDTVLRRYLAGHTLLVDLVIREAGEESQAWNALPMLLGTQVALLDRLLTAVAEEHAREAKAMVAGHSSERRLRTIERLLAGEPVETADLRYEMSAFHIAVLAAGSDAENALRSLAAALDCNLLLASRDETVLWAWLGRRKRLSVTGLLDEVASVVPAGLCLAVGEPGEGLPGWRLSHQQARAAWPMAQQGGETTVRYADVAVLASILQDGVLTESLRTLYLEPLETGRDRGETLRETLRAYFAADRSAASAAAVLGISRQAVSGRLRMVEERIGRPMGSCVTELEIALRIAELARIVPLEGETKQVGGDPSLAG